MGFYDLYRNKVQCASTDKEIAEQDITTQIQNDFCGDPSHEQVYINGISSTKYDVIIQQGDAKDENVSWKMLLSYPYNTFVFKSGDYIHWLYGDSDTIWLATTFDKQYLYASKGRIYKCNNYLKWIDEYGAIQSHACVVGYNLTDVIPDENKNINTPNATTKVTAQLNEYTKNIGLNKRFLFGKNGIYSAYKVQSIQNMVDENLVVFTMQYDSIAASDNLTLGIANYGQASYTLSINQDAFQQSVGYSSTLTATLKLNEEIVSEALEWTSSDTNKATINASTGVFNLLSVGSVTFTCRMVDNVSVSDTVTITISASPVSVKDNRISPQTTELLQNEEVTYTVHSYTKNIVNADTFAITASGVPINYYRLTVVNGNTFKVKNIKKYSRSELLITCTNNVDSTTETISINLKGLY